MTNDEILRKVIEKCAENKNNNFRWQGILDYLTEKYASNNWNEYYQVIFSHDFAKAFFGKEMVQGLETNPNTEELIDVPCWQYDLQQMILEDEPLKYLEKFL